MTNYKPHLERISDLADAIFMVAKNANMTETECIKTLAELISEEIEKINTEEENYGK